MLYRDKVLLFKNLTLKKGFNLLLVEAQQALKINNTIGHPYFATIDPCNLCNLKCVLCSAGGNFDTIIERGKMSIEIFKKIIYNYGEYLIMINLFTFGETFLNKDIFKMVRIASKHGIGIRISTNFQIFNEQMAIEMIQSGLQYLTISVDGSTQEIYEKYRVGGNLKTILQNVELLQKIKIELKSELPFIEFQTLIFKHNQYDIQNVKILADKYNVHHEVLTASPLASNRLDFLPERTSGSCNIVSKTKTCQWLYRWIVVNWNGDIYPCCNTNGYKLFKLGNIDNLKSTTENLINIRRKNIHKNVCDGCELP